MALLVLLLSLVGFSCATQSQQYLQFLNVPDSIQLPAQAKIFASQVPQITNSLMGFSAETPVGWTGKGDLLHRPEAAAVFLINVPDGESTLSFGSKVNSYPLLSDEQPNLDDVSDDLKTSFADKDYTFLYVSKHIYGSNADELSQMSTLDESKVKDSVLSSQLSNLKTVNRWLHTGRSGVKNGVPDVYIFRINGLISVMKENGANSEEMADGLDAVKATINELTHTLNKVYGGNCLVEVVTVVGEDKQRKKRAAVDPPANNTMNLYDFYNGNYSAGFNIIFLVCIIFFLSVFIVAVSMWFIDPGKDSIIYRMTSSRAKKD